MEKIVHPTYGSGIIKAVEKSDDGYWITVEFEGIGEKKLLSLADPIEELIQDH